MPAGVAVQVHGSKDAIGGIVCDALEEAFAPRWPAGELWGEYCSPIISE